MDNGPSVFSALAANDIVALLKADYHCTIPNGTEIRIKNICRMLTRNVLEQCAIVAEDYVLSEDPHEELRGDDVGMAIAAELREVAEERRLSFCR